MTCRSCWTSCVIFVNKVVWRLSPGQLASGQLGVFRQTWQSRQRQTWRYDDLCPVWNNALETSKYVGGCASDLLASNANLGSSTPDWCSGVYRKPGRVHLCLILGRQLGLRCMLGRLLTFFVKLVTVFVEDLLRGVLQLPSVLRDLPHPQNRQGMRVGTTSSHSCS